MFYFYIFLLLLCSLVDKYLISTLFTIVFLIWSFVQVTDSVLYYSALEPTVTGKQTTLTKYLTYCTVEKTLKHLSYIFFHRHLEDLSFNMKNIKTCICFNISL